MRISQTDTEVTITFDKDSDEYKYGFLKLIDIADISNAEMVNFASEFKNLLKKADPKEIMVARWDDLFIEITGTCMDDLFIEITGTCMDEMLKNSPDLAGLVSNFYNQIGEAMGPVSYVGFELRQYFKKNISGPIPYQNWVDEYIYAYEQSDFAK